MKKQIERATLQSLFILVFVEASMMKEYEEMTNLRA